MAGSFVISKTKNGKFSFNLRAGNNQVILTSQTYADKRGATAGVESVRKNGSKDSSFMRKTAKDGSPYFVLVSPNGQVIGTSEMYKSASTMENGINSVKANAKAAKVFDRTS